MKSVCFWATGLESIRGGSLEESGYLDASIRKSGNMHLDNPIEIVKITLVNRHQFAK